jgi:hypothetical protein
MSQVKAPPGTALAAQQEFFDPLQQLLANGCHLTRQNDALLAGAGGKGDGKESGAGTEAVPKFSRLDDFQYINLDSKWPVSYQVTGVLTK